MDRKGVAQSALVVRVTELAPNIRRKYSGICACCVTDMAFELDGPQHGTFNALCRVVRQDNEGEPDASETFWRRVDAFPSPFSPLYAVTDMASAPARAAACVEAFSALWSTYRKPKSNTSPLSPKSNVIDNVTNMRPARAGIRFPAAGEPRCAGSLDYLRALRLEAACIATHPVSGQRGAGSLPAPQPKLRSGARPLGHGGLAA